MMIDLSLLIKISGLLVSVIGLLLTISQLRKKRDKQKKLEKDESLGLFGVDTIKNNIKYYVEPL